MPINLVYEVCIVCNSLIQIVKERHFHYIDLGKTQLKEFK